ncbi:AraC family transcriptional regulator [Ferrimonas balearica]|uniref:AraC family transcriptional regulator n=1 Tax=Ferrimonas balearica TaxID=44012 RepID=UPI001C99E573|nr:helix-turn-helix transcriptional regulator [Ferrimonas balearica]MBY5921020.1 AraC family transcriptional regulator [Ferrimonas balearica]MBY5996295.1 AraC family transcriptional regulator [Ferrimonas balearica]
MKESSIEVLDLALFRSRLEKYRFDPYQPHKVTYFCFLYITEGEGEHWIDSQRYPYSSGSIIFIHPNQVHAFDPGDRPKGKMINITPEFFSSSTVNTRTSYFALLHQSLSVSPVLPLPDELNESCRVLLSEVKKAQREEGNDDVLAQLLFFALVLKLARRCGSHNHGLSKRQMARFEQFLTLVETHYCTTREVSQYAQWMHTNYKSLNQLCKRCSGKTAKQLIDFRIVEETKRKLLIEGLSVQQAAFELGFDDTNYFNKYFKRLTDLTPSAFKRQCEG